MRQAAGGCKQFDSLPALMDGAPMNLATKAPNFTRENAAEMARRATRSRLARIAREREAAAAATRAAAPITDDARRKETCRQLDRVDDLIDEALEKEDLKTLPPLVGAKVLLWKLVFPTAGVLKPSRRTGSGYAPPVAVPLDPTRWTP